MRHWMPLQEIWQSEDFCPLGGISASGSEISFDATQLRRVPPTLCSRSVISDGADGMKTEIRTGQELLTASHGCKDTILLCFERWDQVVSSALSKPSCDRLSYGGFTLLTSSSQEERVGAWISHLEVWDKEGLGPALRVPEPVKELARAGIPHKLRREVYCHLAGVHEAKRKHNGLFKQYCDEIEIKCTAKVLLDAQGPCDLILFGP